MNSRILLSRPLLTMRLTDDHRNQTLLDYTLEIETSGWGFLSIRTSRHKRGELLRCTGAKAVRNCVNLKIQPETTVRVCLISLIGFKTAELTTPYSPISVNLRCAPKLDGLKMIPTSGIFQATLMGHRITHLENPIQIQQKVLALQTLFTLRDFAWRLQLQYPIRIDCSDSKQPARLVIDQSNKFDIGTQLYKISMTKS